PGRAARDGRQVGSIVRHGPTPRLLRTGSMGRTTGRGSGLMSAFRGLRSYRTKGAHAVGRSWGGSGPVWRGLERSAVDPKPTLWMVERNALDRACHSALMPAVLMIGHHFSISAF